MLDNFFNLVDILTNISHSNAEWCYFIGIIYLSSFFLRNTYKNILDLFPNRGRVDNIVYAIRKLFFHLFPIFTFYLSFTLILWFLLGQFVDSSYKFNPFFCYSFQYGTFAYCICFFIDGFLSHITPIYHYDKRKYKLKTKDLRVIYIMDILNMPPLCFFILVYSISVQISDFFLFILLPIYFYYYRL